MAVDFDFTERLPFDLAAAASGVSLAYSDQGVLNDVSIGGLPFFYAINDQQPYVRETNDYKRQQLDTSPEPGEQTLSQWWVRDQTSWHRGSGVQYYEPGTNKATKYRFANAVGVDVWTQDQTCLLKKTDNLGASATPGTYLTGAIVDGVDVIFFTTGGSLHRHDGSTQTVYTGPADAVTRPCLAGSGVLVGCTTGILGGSASGGSLAALWTQAAGVAPVPYWVKNRIIAARGNALFELTLAGGAMPSTPLYVHPDGNFKWTSVVEAPDCILASGYVSGYGYVFAFSLVSGTTAGSTPTLGSAQQVAEFPPGEEVHAMQTFLGSYVAIGTRSGVRIADLGANGKMSYGPLSIVTSQPVRDFAINDRFIFATIDNDIDGGSGVARIDLSEEIFRYTDIGYEISTLRFAWAYDAQAHTSGKVTSVGFLGNSNRVAFVVDTKGVYLQSASDYEATGYLTSGRIRYATAEAKTFAQMKLRASIKGDTSVAIATIDDAQVERTVTTVTRNSYLNNDFSLGAVSETTLSYMSVRLTLAASSDLHTTPIVESVQIKATPSPRIQRNIRMPLRLNDVEQDRNGTVIGFRGSSWIRLSALEQLENDRSVIQVKDLTNGESFSGQIKSIQFVRDTPPSRNETNFGGFIILTLLKL